MQHVTKELIAVLHIFLCIKYVQVPEVIDKTGRHNRFMRMLIAKDKKLTVFFGNTAGEAKRLSMTFFRIHCLDDG